MGATNQTFMTQFGGSTAASAAGAVLGWADELLFGNKRRKDQLKQQEKLQDLQIQGNKEMADYNQNLQKNMFDYTSMANLKNQQEMWDYTGYANQRKQIDLS